MSFIVIVLFSLVFLGVGVFTAGVIAALLIARHELRRHHEEWRLG